jgi:hypothetical protein
MHTFHICVVGLSGNENVKGIKGVGKSCLCSRFLASNKYDDYRRDHISYMSLSDWHSSVINRNHWLYWGSCVKRIDGMLTYGNNTTVTSTSNLTAKQSFQIKNSNNNSNTADKVCFHVIEQTEFINDESMQPFVDDTSISTNNNNNNGNNSNNSSNNNSKSVSHGNSQLPYSKRCATIKLESLHKAVYRRKEQLSVEDYNYGKMSTSESSISIDGFICVVDVTQVNLNLMLLNNVNFGENSIVRNYKLNDNNKKIKKKTPMRN